LSIDSGVTSGRLWRPLALLLAFVALGTVSSADTAWAGDGAVAVKPSQDLVVLLRPHEARSKPGVRWKLLAMVPAKTPITEDRTVLPVLARDHQWLKVRLPGRPNGHTGWIRERATTRFTTEWHVVVNSSTRKVIVYRAGRALQVFRAVVGKPSTPTPLGQFFVEESIALRPTDVGAPFALALSARSNVLQEFEGGPGQIALHGLGNVGGVLGTTVSHGCVRLGNEALRWLVARVGPGTPVTITR
jgi:lipoprotein-anchoring transpeptidase ErfK/SrfK